MLGKSYKSRIILEKLTQLSDVEHELSKLTEKFNTYSAVVATAENDNKKFLTKLTQQKENDVSGYIKNLVVATDINKVLQFLKLSGIKCNEKVILASRIIFAKG